jgi:prevent-host-death family protein
MRTKSTKRPVSIGAAKVRSSLGQIIRRVSAKSPERFLIGVRGKPKAVLMGLEDYLALVGRRPAIMSEIHSLSEATGTDKLTIEEIDAEIADYRRERFLRNASPESHS